MDKGKSLIFSRHARIRMLERNYVGKMVEEAMYHSDREYPGNISGSTVAAKDLGSLELHVCYLERSEYYLKCSVFEGE